MLYYHITSGNLYRDKKFLGTGYSGAGHVLEDGRNNCFMCNVQNKGPIPPGVYSIGLNFEDPERGPMTMRLTPIGNTVTFGRSGFLIHGDNASDDASHGCIILGPSIRKDIIFCRDNQITVLNT